MRPEIEEVEPLTINGDPPGGEPCKFVKDVYLSVFYCLCYATNLTTDYSEEQVLEERDPDLDDMDNIRFEGIREDHWRDLAVESNDKKKIHALRWCVYVKEKEELIKRSFSVSVPHPKGGKIVWTCVKDHVIEEKEDYKEIGIRGFDYSLFLHDALPIYLPTM